MDLSIIIPLYNEAESLPELTQWINQVCSIHQLKHEIIFVDDGSTDSSWEVIQKLIGKGGNTRGIQFRTNQGKSAALQAGFNVAKGKVVITMDADLQDSPDEIPRLYNKLLEQNLDMVSGWKKKRHDNLWTKNIPSKFFNSVTRILSGIKLHDFNCGLKVYKLEVVKAIQIQGEMHRYIPVIASHAGYKKIGEHVVKHQSRKYGKSKFGWTRFVNGFLDLCTLLFMVRFAKRPMHFFGSLGLVSLFLGFGLTTYLCILKLYYQDNYALTVRPSFYLALTMLIIGAIFFIGGFIAELISNKELNEKKQSDIIKNYQ